MYNTTFDCFKVFVPKLDDAGEKIGSIPIKVRRLNIEHIKSQTKFHFGVSRRKGNVTFRDSRDKKSLTMISFTNELKRLVPDTYNNILDEIKDSF